MDDDEPPRLMLGGKFYMTPTGHTRLREELDRLMNIERPRVVDAVSWAAGNGDRSENADYQYGKRRLREIDHRAHFLMKRLASAEVVDPSRQVTRDRVFFGATVTYADESGVERTVTIVGVVRAYPSRYGDSRGSVRDLPQPQLTASQAACPVSWRVCAN
jgi:transcription elongation factor GreB